MRRLLIALALVAVTTLAHAGTSGQDPSGGSPTGGAGGVCDPTTKQVLWGSLSGFAAGLGTAPLAPTTPGTAGQYICGLVMSACTGVYTKISCVVTTGLAATKGECGLFTADGATRVASTGALSTAAAANLTATVSSFTLVSGVSYLACWADSAVATVAYRAIGNLTSWNNVFVNTTFTSGVGATQVAPFNEACTAGSAPYTCCTGLGTGTCLGMADRTGVQGITAFSAIAPAMVMAP
jgi:hypothetical protein